jgi:8-oxo-dGTP diphosphatase
VGPNSESAGDQDAQIKAAGGVVVRADDDGGRRIAVVHRPKYMDWSLPKGKLEPGEGWLDAALREVKEETGFSCEAGRELSPISYRDRKGRTKHVRYWLMEPVKGRFEPHGEVDELRWLSSEQAAELLSYDHDRELVERALARGPRALLRRLTRRG